MKKASRKAVVGGQWGDEGKGKETDAQVDDGVDLCVRYNGANNAGHSLEVNGVRTALHHIPSGILHERTRCVIGNGVLVEPISCLAEIDELITQGVSVTPSNLSISDRCHIIMPHLKRLEQLHERLIGKIRGTPVGTTGKGVGETYAAKHVRSFAVRMMDLLDRKRLEGALQACVVEANAHCLGLADELGESFIPFSADDLLEPYLGLGSRLAPYVVDTHYTLRDAIAMDQDILFEGANGTLLSLDHGTFPYVTSSEPSVLGIPTGSGMAGHLLTDIIVVFKAYTTRVGNGPMPTRFEDAISELIRKTGNEFGTTTGRPRDIGWFDAVAARYSMEINRPTAVVLTLLDVLSGLSTIKIAIGYTRNGRTVPFPSDALELSQVAVQYHEVKGWQQDIRQCRRFSDLPAEAKAYVYLIEDLIGMPISVIGVGPDRRAIIDRRQELVGVRSNWWSPNS